MIYGYWKPGWRERIQFKKSHQSKKALEDNNPVDAEFVPEYVKLDAPNHLRPRHSVHKNIYIDESGTPNPNTNNKLFVMGAIVSDDDRMIEKVTGNFPRNLENKMMLPDGRMYKTKVEYKYSYAVDNRPDDCDETMSDLGSVPLDYYLKVLKKDPSDPRQNKRIYMDTLRDLVLDIKSYDDSAMFDVYLDRGNLEKSEVAEALKGIPDLEIHDPYATEGMPGLRAADFVTSAAGYHYNRTNLKSSKHYDKYKGRIVNRNKKNVPGLKPRSTALPTARFPDTMYRFDWGYLTVTYPDYIQDDRWKDW